jgi:hypothetical protein
MTEATESATIESTGDLIDGAAEQTQTTSPDGDLIDGNTSESTSESQDIAAQEQEAPKKAPEKYEFTGLDETVSNAYAEVARELDLSQDDATKILAAVQPKMQEAQNNALMKAGEEWKQQVIADPELGGQNLSKTMGDVKNVLDKFATPEFVQLLKVSRLCNNPEVIRTFAKIGKAISQDAELIQGKSVSTPVHPANVVYPNMN